MLEYEKQIFLDILQDDGLVVTAKGLGLDSVIVNLLKVYCDPGNLVFVLGTEGKFQEWILDSLKKTGVSPQPRVSVETGAAERKQSYLEGGLWFVPPRIIVVDILKKRLPVDLITGFIVCKAHNILKNHLDAFVLRLFRQENKNGFIKAFSDQAPAFRGGFNKVEQILKALYTRNLLLWPRYHAVVKSSLSQCKSTVIELHLEMTKKMVQLQNALLDLIKLTIEELKRLNPMLHTEDLTVENVINETLHKVLHSQLDEVWHALSERTKALLTDLKLFHYMILSLMTRDSVSFYAFINSQRKSENAMKGSGWHFLPPAEILFSTAEQRVFPKANSDPSDPKNLNAEPNPKWVVLSEILVEIHKEFSKESKGESKATTKSDQDIEKQLASIFGEEEDSKPSANVDGEPESPADILILTRDERNCSLLQMYLTLGGEELLAMQYRKFFSSKTFSKRIVGDKEEGESSKDADEVPAQGDMEGLEDIELDTYTLSLSQIGFSKLEGDGPINVAGYFEDSHSMSQRWPPENEESMSMTQPDMNNRPMILIKSYNRNLLSMPQLLEEQKPRWIIIYDPDMTLVRQLEVYQRNNPGIQVKVYFLAFGGTIEEQSYLTSLRKEKEAFDFLIEEKARIVIPGDVNDYPELYRPDNESDALTQTRKGGLEPSKKEPPRIIVDMREFRSELPALIHSRGIEIEPLTITIGDYILTPDICLERKSVSDLIHSLNSGRLYNQALAMTRHYSKPMLLIEFDKDKPFDLQDRYYLSTDASSEQVITKLQLLTLHFPQLRLVWSPSPLATAQLFEELKQGHPEPDVETALGLGVEQTATDEDKFNPGIQKFVSNLPGVTNKNLHPLLSKGKSLDHLQKLSQDELSNLLQNSVEGEILFRSLHNKFYPDESSSSISSNKGKFKPGGIRGKRKRFH